MLKRSFIAGALFLGSLCAFSQHADTLRVGPNAPFSSIQAAIDAAPMQENADVQSSTVILIAPGNYEEMLTISKPGIRLVNAAGHDIRLLNKGVCIGAEAVRITGHYGHGYNYFSMASDCAYDADTLAANLAAGRPSKFNYGGSRARCWNATVYVDAPRFSAEGIIFENSFNQYISLRESQDSLVDISQADVSWSKQERPKRAMPDRPRTPGNTDVQRRFYRERASAMSFTTKAEGCCFSHCRFVGRQDVIFGDSIATVVMDSCILMGAVDYIFGGMDLLVTDSELVPNLSSDKGETCYIAAAKRDFRQGGVGYTFVNCRIRSAIPLVEMADSVPVRAHATYLGRPWRPWSRCVFVDTYVEAVPDAAGEMQSLLHPEGWSDGLARKFVPERPLEEGATGSPFCYEQGTIEQSGADTTPQRVPWAHVLE